MEKIWAKVMQEDKIVQQYVYPLPEKLVYAHFHQYLFAICEKLDIAAPILLKNHIFQFAKFHFIKFIQRDFIEEIYFDSLYLEFLK